MKLRSEVFSSSVPCGWALDLSAMETVRARGKNVMVPLKFWVMGLAPYCTTSGTAGPVPNIRPTPLASITTLLPSFDVPVLQDGIELGIGFGIDQQQRLAPAHRDISRRSAFPAGRMPAWGRPRSGRCNPRAHRRKTPVDGFRVVAFVFEAVGHIGKAVAVGGGDRSFSHALRRSRWSSRCRG